MMGHMFSWLSRKKTARIEPESLWAYRSRLPAQLEVSISIEPDGGLTAIIENLPGVFTEADSFEDLCEMINYSIFDYLGIPEEYVPHLKNYVPSPELVEKMKRIGVHTGGSKDALGRKGTQQEDFRFVLA